MELWGPYLIIFPFPLLYQYLCFFKCRRDFPVKKLISELAVKGFNITVLPRAAWFYIQGIDFENHAYLIEAKFQYKPVGQQDLLAFCGKVEGKATWSRGIFISVSNFTGDGLAAFSRGRPTNLIAISGQDLFCVVDGQMPLDEVIRLKARRAAETGEVMIPIRQLLLEY